MRKYFSIFTAFGFYKIFGEETKKIILIDFLNSLLPNDMLIKDAGKLVATPDTFPRMYVLHCENEKGEKFIVHLQKAERNYFRNRDNYYANFPVIKITEDN